MIRSTQAAAMLAFGASLAISSVATAQAGQTNAEKAQTLYKEGIDLYFAEDYGLAITKFRSGYQLDPNPMFLYSLSLCFHKLGNLPDALDHAQRADETGGMSQRDTTSNQARIFAYSIGISADEVATNVKNNRPPAGSCLTNRHCEGEGEICNIATKQCVVESEPDAPGAPLPFGPVGFAGIGATAVGIGLLVGGGITSLSVKKKEDELATMGAGDQQAVDDLVTKIDKQKNLGKFLILGGVGMTAVGVGLFVVDMFVLQKMKDESKSAFHPILLPEGGGIGWSARF